MHGGGSWRDLVVAWDLRAVIAMPSFGEGRAQTSPTEPWGSSARAAWGFRASLESGGVEEAPGNPVHPREAAGLMTSHHDLSPQSDLSEVKMSAGGQGVGVPVRGERILNQRNQRPEGNVTSCLLEWQAYRS